MSLRLLLLMLLACDAWATHFYGTVMTYYPQNTNADGSMSVVLRYKLNFHSCTQSDTWTCLSGNCGTETPTLHIVHEHSDNEWCQREGIMSRTVPNNSPFQLLLSGGNWISNIKNSIVSWSAVTLVELRSRSDTGQANRSPQTTILPAVRVPSNCQRDFNLLAFDPDGDVVKCRFGSTSLNECNPCNPPSVLNLSSSCSLSFSPTSSSNEGPYAVQLVMEDFPRQNITLIQINGSQEVKTTSDAISKIPIQFVVRVDSTVPSCTEGVYLPKFLPPTPANGARLFSAVNQTLEININAVANMSTISELLFSGPFNTNRTKSATGQYILRWTPSETEDGESHPICFVVQAKINSVKYDSELRCVIVSVSNETTTPMTEATTATPVTNETTTPMTEATTATPVTNETTTPVTDETTTTPVTDDETTTPETDDETTTPETDDETTTTPVTETTTTTPVTNTTTTTTVTEATTTTPVTKTTTTTPVTNTTTTTTTLTNETTTSGNTGRIIVVLRARITASSLLSSDFIRTAVVQKITEELVKQGLPSNVTIRSVQLQSTTVTPAGGG